MKTHFNNALENLQNLLSEVAAAAESAVHLAFEAVDSNSEELANQVIDHDVTIDEMEVKIEEECLKILALYQPVATDLRQVITILKVNNELERVGDLAVNIAERVKDMIQYQDSKIEKPYFGDMVYKACEMLRMALDSLTMHEVTAAVKVIDSDEAVDQIHRANYDLVRESMLRHPKEAGYFFDWLTVSRCLERIADIATNIAEDVIYLESGRIVRHRHEGEKNNHGK